eukprot:1525186-Pleurochrysis_carterae.AAC.2
MAHPPQHKGRESTTATASSARRARPAHADVRSGCGRNLPARRTAGLRPTRAHSPRRQLSDCRQVSKASMVHQQKAVQQRLGRMRIGNNV